MKKFLFRTQLTLLVVLSVLTNYSSLIRAQENMALTLENRDIERFHQQSERMAQGNVDLLMIGDSITHGWEGAGKDVWNKYYGNRNAMNFGISGDRTGHVLWRLANSPLDKISPKMAVVMIGTNNIGHGSSNASQTVQGIQKIIDVLKEKYPAMKILLLEVFPRDNKPEGKFRQQVNEINAGLGKIYANKAVENVQLYSLADLFLTEDGTLPPELMPDFLHPNAAGYEIWAKAVEPMIAEGLGEEPNECKAIPRNDDWWQNRFKEKNEILKNGNIDLLMIGDSITHGWEGAGKDVWNKYYGDKKAVNLGIGGDQTHHVIWRLENYDFSNVNPKLAVLLIGVNNVASGSTGNNTAYGNRKIVEILHEKFPELKIIVLNVFPWGNKDELAKHEKVAGVNELLPYYVRDLDYVTLVNINDIFLNENGELPADIMPDFLHPNAVGYEKWGAALDQMITEKLQ
ncbi:MAG: GDSL-type esterase/lipase family protein [Planctomycetia bacterium]|nr:GDSL-type esterase/lipase family protein [Planctomycetia bacterium]